MRPAGMAGGSRPAAVSLSRAGAVGLALSCTCLFPLAVLGPVFGFVPTEGSPHLFKLPGLLAHAQICAHARAAVTKEPPARKAVTAERTQLQPSPAQPSPTAAAGVRGHALLVGLAEAP